MKNKTGFPWKRGLVCGVILLAVSALGVCLIGLLVWKEYITVEISKIAVQVVTSLLLYGACWMISRRAEKGRLQLAVYLAAVYLAGMLLIGAACFSGLQFQFGYELFLPLAASILGALTAATPKSYRR